MICTFTLVLLEIKPTELEGQSESPAETSRHSVRPYALNYNSIMLNYHTTVSLWLIITPSPIITCTLYRCFNDSIADEDSTTKFSLN